MPPPQGVVSIVLAIKLGVRELLQLGLQQVPNLQAEHLLTFILSLVWELV